MVNTDKLRGKIVERRLTVGKLAEQIGIDRATLYRKMNDKGQTISIKEADAIAEILNLSESEAVSIFFTQYVAYYANKEDD